MKFLEVVSMEVDFHVFFWKGPVRKDNELRPAPLTPRA